MKKKGIAVPTEPTYMVKGSDIQKIKEDTTDNAVTTAMVLLLALPIKVLHDKYGWGMRKRLPEIAEAIIDEYESFAAGEMTLEQYSDMVYEYCGMKFKKNDE